MSENGNTISNADKKRLGLLMGAANALRTGPNVVGLGSALYNNKDIIGELIGSLSNNSKTPSPIPIPDEIKRRRPKMSNKKVPSPIPIPAKIKQMRADKARRDSKGGDYSENPVMQTRRNNKGMKEGGAVFPDLTGDGKVTKKDILKGRGVKGFKNGGCVMAGRGGKFKGIS